MDIIYLIRPGEQNEELRYSLRSLSHFPHGDVWIAGHKPHWVCNVRHIPLEQPTPPAGMKHPKWFRSWMLLRAVCEHPDTPDDFILFNDDFFVMQPISDIPTLHRGPIDAVIAGRNPRTNVYVNAMLETKNLLAELGKDALCYEMHTPFVLNRNKMFEAIRIAERARKPGMHYVNKRSLYGNYWGIGGTQVDDVKVDNAHPDFDAQGAFLSTTENSFKCKPVGAHIRSRFPAPCYYEATSL